MTELMVALAIIGILVAVVTPTIMKTRPNKNKMMVKKTFYTTEQIVATLINDQRLYPDLRDACEDDWIDDSVECAWGFDYDKQVKYEGETYQGNTKFEGLFRSRLNVKSGDDDVFFTTDGVKWDLSGTEGAWTSNKSTPGSFDDQTNAAGIGEILIDVNGDDEPNCRQTDTGCDADNFDQYVIQVLATGKMQVDPDDAKAVEWVTINTSIRDAL